MIKLKNICKTYTSKNSHVKAIDNISITFKNKGMTFILGRSGSGKSTLLNIIGGLDSYEEGNMTILNKSSQNFNENDFDSYRNTYVGFIFQDFNLLDDHDVYHNISIALQLQQKTIDEEKIDKLLSDLGILNLKNRKINQLSGGQKQRVAIARALIKEPKIILADEPTGNLDSETGMQVLELLKKISKKRLVIVVSHDQESAKKFADRIIEIKDGKIVNDTNDTNDESTKIQKECYNSIKSKLPFKDCIKLGFETLKHKKTKLISTIALTSFTLLCLGLAFTLATYDEAKSQAKSLVQNDVSFVQIEKKEYYNKADKKGTSVILSEQDQTNIFQKTTQFNHNNIYKFSDDNLGKTLIDVLRLNITLNVESYDYDLYTQLMPIPEIIATDNIKDVITEDIYGREPTTDNEIVISNYIADLIISNGIEIYNENNADRNIFKPKNYEELIITNNSFYFGNLTNIKIVGIIQFDLTKYELLKGKKYDDLKKSEYNLPSDLNQKSQTIYNKIFVNNGFISKYNVSNTNTLSSNNLYEITSNNLLLHDYTYNIQYGYLQNDIEYYDGKKWTRTNSISKNQIILNVRHLVNFDLMKYLKDFDNYLSKRPTDNPNDLEKEFLLSYIDSTSIIGNKVTFNILKSNNSVLQSFNNLEIIGITGLTTSENTQTLLSEELIKEYKSSTFKLSGIFVNETNEIKLQHLFRLFPIYSKYSMQTPYSESILVLKDTMNMLKKVAYYTSAIFLVFTIVLICNFIFTSVNYRKKEIGILRALGTRQIDIIKIFLWEGIFISIISAIISSLLLCCTSQILNNTIMNDISIVISPFIIAPKTVILLFPTVLAITLLSSIVPLHNISKMKPVDAIYSK